MLAWADRVDASDEDRVEYQLEDQAREVFHDRWAHHDHEQQKDEERGVSRDAFE